MDLVKDIAAVIGLIMSAAALASLILKPVRNAIKRLFVKYGNTDETSRSLVEIREMLEAHVAEEAEAKRDRENQDFIMRELTKTLCRYIIKTIFYNYKDTRVLPMYEKETLNCVEELYINIVHGNSFAAFLLEQMRGWEVDYENIHPDSE